MATGDGMGQNLRQIRHARGKSLAVVAGLAGISSSYLSRLESGDRALDRRSLIVALAEALEVAPSEITRTAITTAGELDEDRSLNAVRLALLAVSMDSPSGQVLPVESLTPRVTQILTAQRDCDYALVGAQLPSLIRDLHATLGGGRDVGAVLRLLVLTHVQGTQAWLGDIGASPDLAWQAAHFAETIDPHALPSPTRQSAYYREYGRALARIPKQRDTAVMMLRRAEQISPARIHRHPFMRAVLAELLAKAKRDALGRELRGMAYRSGLPV